MIFMIFHIDHLNTRRSEFLKARTSGSGKIGYKGNPELDYPKKSMLKGQIGFGGSVVGVFRA